VLPRASAAKPEAAWAPKARRDSAGSLQQSAKSGGIFSATLSVNWSFSYQLPAFSCGECCLVVSGLSSQKY
jgi:hypothetical protein